MSTKIYPIGHKHVNLYLGREMRKERVAIKKIDRETEYLTYMNGVHPVAVVGWMEMKSKSVNHIRLKTDYVRLLFRGKKIYTQLWDARFSLILSKYNPDEKGTLMLTAFCTPMSLPLYKKRGFNVERTHKNGISYVKLYIKPKKNAKLQGMESGVPEEKSTLHPKSSEARMDTISKEMSEMRSDRRNFTYS